MECVRTRHRSGTPNRRGGQLTAYLPGQNDAANGNRVLVKSLIDDVRSEYRATLTMLIHGRHHSAPRLR